MTPAEPGGSTRTWRAGYLADWEIRAELEDPTITPGRRPELEAELEDRRRSRAQAARDAQWPARRDRYQGLYPAWTVWGADLGWRGARHCPDATVTAASEPEAWAKVAAWEATADRGAA